MRIINMVVKITGDEEFMRCGSSYRKEVNSSRKTEKGLAKVEDAGGR